MFATPVLSSPERKTWPRAARRVSPSATLKVFPPSSKPSRPRLHQKPPRLPLSRDLDKSADTYLEVAAFLSTRTCGGP